MAAQDQGFHKGVLYARKHTASAIRSEIDYAEEEYVTTTPGTSSAEWSKGYIRALKLHLRVHRGEPEPVRRRYRGRRRRSNPPKRQRVSKSSDGPNWLLWGAIALGLYLLLKPKTAAADDPSGHPLRAQSGPIMGGVIGPPQQVTVNLPDGDSFTASEPVDGFGTYFYVR